MAFLKNIFGDDNTRTLKKIEPIVRLVNAREEETRGFSDIDFPEKTSALKKRYADGEPLDDLLPEAFALVREAASRTLEQRHYDVQLIGGVAMYQGNIAEMKTGEGKTLVATLPAYLNALAGRGVHIITVNDYLSRRDVVWMGQIYAFLGLSVGCINHEASFLYDPGHIQKDEERDELGAFKVVHEFLKPCTRAHAYSADITYGTNNEFGFDYLRDNLARKPEEVSQRGHAYAIVDEIDSILIDEARTPLIISAPAQESDEFYKTFAGIAAQLKSDEDFTVEEKFKSIALTDNGIEKTEKILGVDNIYTEKGIKYVHHLETAVRARALFTKDKEYVVRDGKIIIVDEFTGRFQPGRRWSEGLHQAIEAKEGVPIEKESRTVASITFQNYFRMYEQLAGMTGTAMTSREEFRNVYNLDVVAIPTHKPIARIDQTDLIYQSEEGKFSAIARKAKDLHAKGQPVLIGTVSIEKNELLSEYLKKEGIPHEILNAKKHEQEGEIVAQAGRKGSVVIATNMAGRGVDIKLGGNPGSPEEYDAVKRVGGLFVLGTERHEARRIDNQLRGRAGRQGDPGETQFFVSFDDSLMRVFASDTIKNMMGRFGIPEDQPIENKIITRSLETAQERIEGFNFDARRHVLDYDNVLNKQRQTIYGERSVLLIGGQSAAREYLDRILVGNDELHQKVESKKESIGEEKFYEAVRMLMLQTIDMLWMEHLETMDYLRSSVRLRAYGQRDPLVEYKKEGIELFSQMRQSVRDTILRHLSNMDTQAITQGLAREKERELKEVHPTRSNALQSNATSNGTSENIPAHSHKPQNSDGQSIGRNDPCYCGSEKKFKRCHGV